MSIPRRLIWVGVGRSYHLPTSPGSTLIAMSSSALAQLAAQFSRQMASSAAGGIGRKVAVLGAAGGIGQPLSMLMKVRATHRNNILHDRHRFSLLSLYFITQMNQQVSQLSLYDIAGTPGVGADVSHINTRAQVKVSCSLQVSSA